MTSALQLPSSLAHLEAAEWEAITIGRSSASVWRLHHQGETFILKRETARPTSELPSEAERLRWLETMEMPAPRQIAFASTADSHFLLMTAVEGEDLTALADDPERLCTILAKALHQLHDLPTAACPFDHAAEKRIAVGRRNISAGLVDESDFDDERLGWSASQVLDWLGANPLNDENFVVTHGDASIPNFMATSNGFAGMVDCGRVGVADRWQDLAIACRSVADNCGQQHIETFLRAYGEHWNERRYRYFTTLDELF
ncbi:aminoglycoside O-phosphotransferase APH(3')-IIb [Devosia pacifica]|uniref:Aminoglycoside 3'-phosphotransferase n=1 Tax=Devosia pacifica TaxID=1335967 RepID=A0A918VP70_9HYPH|nr:APH(3') family aminoglycoside O-phosphotransferase [Devosia pacifica]GHA12130.1 aminoglycoside O-phosphotransferase APH(3')-IIb [Devosia pacifica]